MPGLEEGIPIGTVLLPQALFQPNWADGAENECSWSTDVVEGLSADEARRGLGDKPFRVIKIRGLTLSRGQAGAFLVSANKNTGNRFYAPLASDVAQTTASSSGLVITVTSTADRRFFVGYKAMVLVYDKNLKAVNSHVGEIASLTTNTITFVFGQGPAFTVPVGAEVFPALECEVNLHVRATAATDTHIIFDLDCRERVGNTALPALSIAEEVPGGEPTYQAIPILVIPHTWERTEVGASRKATVTRVGLDDIIEIYGVGSVFTGRMTFRGLDRAKAFRVIKFFESRAGSLFSFWLPGQTADLEVVARTSGAIWTVSKTLATATDILERRFLAAWSAFTDDVAIRRVLSVTDGGTVWIITFESDMPFAAASDVDRFSFASLAKFDTDSISENWRTNGTMEAVLPVIGLQVNTCNTGEMGDAECDEFPDIPPPNTDDDPEPPWISKECSPSGISVPMFFDATQALNSWREPIRGGDLAMPQFVYVSFKDGFVQDATHSHVPTLSTQLMKKLIAEHELTFQGFLVTAGAGFSRNPYDIRLQGSANDWGAAALPGVAVERPYWNRIIPYSVGVSAYELEIRLVAEYADSFPADGHGMWGTKFCIYAKSTEVNPTYVDGTAWAPSNNAVFYWGDPYVWGGYYGAADDIKYAHPQLLIAAFAATTWHAPVGYNWVPPDQQRFKFCYKKSNGAPWSAGSDADAVKNCVFGISTGSYRMRAMSLGGWQSSKFFPYVCIENGQGQGITALKPTRAGWDEAVGDLTVEEGSDCSIKVCNPGQTAINSCAGHPDDPVGGVGGTHACYRNRGGDEYLCIPPEAALKMGVQEACCTISTKYDAACDPEDQSCSTNLTETPFNLVLWDYDFAFGGDVTNRLITWRGYYDLKSYARQHWEYEVPADLDEWVAARGSWTKAASGKFTCTAVVGASTPSAVLEYAPGGGYTFDDGSVHFIAKAGALPIGVAVRRTSAAGNDTCYLLIWDRSVGKGQIYRQVAGVTTLLSEEIDFTDTGDIPVEVIADGATLKLTINKDTGIEKSVTAEHCEIQSGGSVALVVLGNAAGEVFDEVTVGDGNWRKSYVQVSVDDVGLILAQADDEICALFGICETETGAGCPGDLICPCVHTDQTIAGIYTLSTAGYPAIGPISPLGIGLRDPVCTLESCVPPAPMCGECPPPFRAMWVQFPKGLCEDPANPSEWVFKEGVEYWRYDPASCP